MTKTLSTTIKKKWFNEKMKDLTAHGFFVEYKYQKDYWNKRITKDVTELVSLVGSQAHRFKVTDVQRISLHDVPEKYQAALTTPYVYAVKCVCVKPIKS